MVPPFIGPTYPFLCTYGHFRYSWHYTQQLWVLATLHPHPGVLWGLVHFVDLCFCLGTDWITVVTSLLPHLNVKPQGSRPCVCPQSCWDGSVSGRALFVSYYVHALLTCQYLRYIPTLQEGSSLQFLSPIHSCKQLSLQFNLYCQRIPQPPPNHPSSRPSLPVRGSWGWNFSSLCFKRRQFFGKRTQGVPGPPSPPRQDLCAMAPGLGTRRCVLVSVWHHGFGSLSAGDRAMPSGLVGFSLSVEPPSFQLRQEQSRLVWVCVHTRIVKDILIIYIKCIITK